jgi:hypothetical protein
MNLNIEAYSSADLLRMKVPESLYTNDAETAKKEYRRLSMKWHPDRGGAEDVFQHIKFLYEQAEKKIQNGFWKIPGQLEFTTIDGRKFQIHYRKHHTFELGEMYISDTVVAYMIDKSNKDLVESARRAMRSFKYENDKMKTEFKKYLPDVKLEAETDDHYVVVYSKTADLLLLSDVIEYHKSKSDITPPPHIAWILSSLYNLECYLNYCGISHNAISPETYFISPEFHSGALLGGWWYSSKIGERLIAVPQRTLNHCADYLKTKKSEDGVIDLQLIKTTGLELLGDANGSSLPLKTKADPKRYPKPFVTWLRTPAGSAPIESYSTYKKKVLVDSWGKPKFHELKLLASDIYET